MIYLFCLQVYNDRAASLWISQSSADDAMCLPSLHESHSVLSTTRAARQTHTRWVQCFERSGRYTLGGCSVLRGQAGTHKVGTVF